MQLKEKRKGKQSERGKNEGKRKLGAGDAWAAVKSRGSLDE
jgi:hypothetical protein